MRFALLLLPFALLLSCASPRRTTFEPTPAQVRMMELISKRLELAREVAWRKYQDSLPVHDPKREAALLQNLVERGRTIGVSEPVVLNFFEAQLEASRALQSFLIRKWQRGAPLPALAPRRIVPDIRDDLDAVSTEMLRLLPEIAPSDAFAARTASALRAEGFPSFVAGKAARPLGTPAGPSRLPRATPTE